MSGMFGMFGSLIIIIYIAIPAIVLYFLMKLAIKNAIKELKKEDIL